MLISINNNPAEKTFYRHKKVESVPLTLRYECLECKFLFFIYQNNGPELLLMLDFSVGKRK